MRTLAAAVLLLAVALPGTATAAPGSTPEGVSVPALDWRACDGGFECTTADVPRDYARPHGETVRLALIRRRAADPEHRIGTLFVNPGGPGSSGVDFVRHAPPVAFQALSRFDWVGFDPRGVGAGEPAIDCDELPAPFTPMTPDTFDLPALLHRARALSRLCLNRDPAFLAGLTTGNVARDLDVLRAAVGDRRLTFLGLSYGGMLGETYANLFPGRTRALVLDSPLDADVWLNRPLQALLEQNVSFEDELDRFFAVGGVGGDDPEQAYDDLLARLDATPLHALDGNAVRTVVNESLYSRANWRSLAEALSGLQAGDPQPFLALEASVIGPGYDLLYDRFDTYGSVERRLPKRVGPYLRYAEQSFSVAPHFATALNEPVYESVRDAFWPIRPRGAFYGPFGAQPEPALVLASTHDPAAPYAWARRVARRLGHARLLTLRGDGHGVLSQLNACALAAVVPYLNSLTLPPAGAICQQEVP
jgi:pimeloyl-ACP methyl ester carboxylesterase